MGNRKQRPLKQRGGVYGHGHLFQLCVSGRDFFGDGFGNGPEAEAEMKTVWPILREKVFALLHERKKQGKHYPLLPWGWWQFESPENRDTSIQEAEQLERMGIPYFSSQNQRNEGKQNANND